MNWSLKPTQLPSYIGGKRADSIFNIVKTDGSVIGTYTVRKGNHAEHYIRIGDDATNHYKFLDEGKALLAIEEVVKTGHWSGE